MPLAKKRFVRKLAGEPKHLPVNNRMLTPQQVMNRGGYALVWERAKECARREKHASVEHD